MTRFPALRLPAVIFGALGLAAAIVSLSPSVGGAQVPAIPKAPVAKSGVELKGVSAPAILAPAASATLPMILTADIGITTRSFVVKLGGGAGATRLSVSAGAYSDRFTVASADGPLAKMVAPSSTAALQADAARLSAANTAASANTNYPPAPAHDVEVGVRLFGAGEKVPSAIPVTLTVTDSRGQTQSLVFNLQATQPTTLSGLRWKPLVPGVTGGLTAGVLSEVELTFTGSDLAAFDEAKVEYVTVRGCAAAVPKVDFGYTPVQGGVWKGRAQVAFGAAGRCQMSVTLTGRRGKTTGTVSAYAPEHVVVAEPALVVVEDTWAAFDGAALALTSGPGSVCQGVSSALGGADHPVGKEKVDGDIAFVIRSGPVGTTCMWSARPTNPPLLVGRKDGVHLASVEVEVEGTEACRSPGAAVPPGFTLGRLDFMNGLVIDDDTKEKKLAAPAHSGLGDVVIEGVSNVWGPSGRGGDFFVEDAPLTVGLDCNPTATNDHFVRVRVTRATWAVPPGLKAPGK